MTEFRSRLGVAAKPKSPVHLFQFLTSRSPSIRFLWAHQQAILEAYFPAHKDAEHVALELPTGSGKTLVGMLIGEYRRRALGQRVAVLCPTRQLAGQVAQQAEDYGISAVLLVGRQRDYDTGDFLKYESAKAVAVTTYSAVFNTNPRIDAPETLICDDAHAAGDFVADMWSLQIQRARHEELFDDVVQLLGDVVPSNARPRLAEADSYDRRYVDAVSPILLWEHLPDLGKLFDVALSSTAMQYQWSVLRDHLDACMLYCSPTSLEMRPVIPPTLTHAPFSDARQRVYMSATLGEDGDLERSFGVAAITRLPAPPGDWPDRGTGRRLVLFPGMASVEDPAATAFDAAKKAGRVLVLTASRVRRDWVSEQLTAAGFTVSGADGVGEAIRDFGELPEPAALVLANRYDGIDLPGDACRMEVVDGLPRGLGHQETFLLDRLHATAELRDRIRTRVTQAIGRCTRDEADYAVIVALGDDFLKWVANSGNRTGMRSELQAEFEFGMAESEDRSGDEIVDLCVQFLRSPAARETVEAAVANLKEGIQRQADPCSAALSKSVSFEVDFTYKLWQADYPSAHAAARCVIDALEGGKELTPYVSFWFHQAAVSAYLAWKESGTGQYRRLCAGHIDGALSTSRGVRWYSTIKAMLAGELDVGPQVMQESAPWFERVDALLTEWGLRGSRFARHLARVEEGIRAPRAARFEEALECLGRMLGAESSRPSGQGVCDGVWTFGGLAFVFEAKSDADSAGSISLDTVRQTVLHEKRARKDGLISVGAACTTVLVSPQRTLDTDAAKIAGDTRHISQSDIVRLFEKARHALEAVRTFETQDADDSLIQKAVDEYARRSLDAESLNAEWFATLLRDLPSPIE